MARNDCKNCKMDFDFAELSFCSFKIEPGTAVIVARSLRYFQTSIVSRHRVVKSPMEYFVRGKCNGYHDVERGSRRGHHGWKISKNTDSEGGSDVRTNLRDRRRLRDPLRTIVTRLFKIEITGIRAQQCALKRETLFSLPPSLSLSLPPLKFHF